MGALDFSLCFCGHVVAKVTLASKALGRTVDTTFQQKLLQLFCDFSSL